MRKVIHTPAPTVPLVYSRCELIEPSRSQNGSRLLTISAMFRKDAAKLFTLYAQAVHVPQATSKNIFGFCAWLSHEINGGEQSGLQLDPP
jgi:hypothetical protein